MVTSVHTIVIGPIVLANTPMGATINRPLLAMIQSLSMGASMTDNLKLCRDFGDSDENGETLALARATVMPTQGSWCGNLWACAYRL